MIERARAPRNMTFHTEMPWLSWQNALRGALVYGVGDTSAASLLGQFDILRMIGIAAVGSTLYAIEIPAYFRWLQRRFDGTGYWPAVARALLAQAFFNPIWIARHMAFVKLFSGRFADINDQLLLTAAESFVHMLPVGLIMNYLIQNRVPLPWRFFASACYSALTTLYFAFGEVLFV